MKRKKLKNVLTWEGGYDIISVPLKEGSFFVRKSMEREGLREGGTGGLTVKIHGSNPNTQEVPKQ